MTHLPSAGGQDRAFRKMEIETGRFPWEAKELDQPPALGFDIRNQLLVIDDQRLERKHPLPMDGQPFDLQSPGSAIPQVVSIELAIGEMVEVAGERDVP